MGHEPTQGLDPAVQDKIDHILDHFDFESVKKAMDALEWTYAWTDGVPRMSDLRKVARRLLRDVANSEEYKSIKTGGFQAVRFEHGKLELNFIVESWDTEAFLNE